MRDAPDVVLVLLLVAVLAVEPLAGAGVQSGRAVALMDGHQDLAGTSFGVTFSRLLLLHRLRSFSAGLAPDSNITPLL